MSDDLVEGVEVGVGLVRLAWRVVGPYTWLLGAVALIWAGVDVMAHDKWVPAGVALTLGGLLLGWLVDLVTRLVVRPLARLAGLRATGWRSSLALGAPVCGTAIAVLAYYDWI